MTITDVAGLKALPSPTVFTDRTGNVCVTVKDGFYVAGLVGMRGFHLARFPLEVLSPRTVTPEQVEAGARAMFEHLGMTWEVAVDDEKRDSREVVLAALAAMGIEVSDG